MNKKLKQFLEGYDNPSNKYEENPLMAWLVFIALGAIIISGLIIVFKI